MSTIPIKSHNYNLDLLRSIAIILVFMTHYAKLTGYTTFGIFSQIGGIDVDLFFVLSGYLIGNQLFSAVANQRKLSLTLFYYRRLLRTVPNYLFIVLLYFLIPSYREAPLVTPLWKFLTFTQNFGLNFSAYSHAWSLCVEEQFYLVLPLLALWFSVKKSLRTCWIVLIAILVGGMLLRAEFWFYCMQDNGLHMHELYHRLIYYPSWSRLDGLTLGVSLAILKNFYRNIWH